MVFKFLGVAPLSEFEWVRCQKKEGVLISYAQYLAEYFRGALLETADALENKIFRKPTEEELKENPWLISVAPNLKEIRKLLRVSAGETK